MGAQTQSGTDAVQAPAGISYIELFFALMGGPVAWFLRLIAVAALTPFACATGRTWTIWAATGVAVAITVAALLSALRFRRQAPAGDNATQIGGAGWVGLVGAMMNIVALSGIIFELAAVIFVPICSRGL